MRKASLSYFISEEFPWQYCSEAKWFLFIDEAVFMVHLHFLQITITIHDQLLRSTDIICAVPAIHLII